MLSSHRTASTATTPDADGVFGKAPEQTLKFRIIADRHANNTNQINDEWMIRDIAAISNQSRVWRQKSTLVNKSEIEGGVEQCPYPFTPQSRHTRSLSCVKWQWIRSALRKTYWWRVMSAEFSVIPKEYDRACIGGHYRWSNCALHSQRLTSFDVTTLFLPNAEFKIHHRIGRKWWNDVPTCCYSALLVATRQAWSKRLESRQEKDVYIRNQPA